MTHPKPKRTTEPGSLNGLRAWAKKNQIIVWRVRELEGWRWATGNDLDYESPPRPFRYKTEKLAIQAAERTLLS